MNIEVYGRKRLEEKSKMKIYNTEITNDSLKQHFAVYRIYFRVYFLFVLAKIYRSYNFEIYDIYFVTQLTI